MENYIQLAHSEIHRKIIENVEKDVKTLKMMKTCEKQETEDIYICKDENYLKMMKRFENGVPKKRRSIMSYTNEIQSVPQQKMKEDQIAEKAKHMHNLVSQFALQQYVCKLGHPRVFEQSFIGILLKPQQRCL